jgi:hypothetical protein
VTGRLLIFGFGYTAQAIAARLPGWRVVGTTRDGREGTLAFDDPAVERELATATHVLSSVPPDSEGDPVLARFGPLLGHPGEGRDPCLSDVPHRPDMDPSLRWGDGKRLWLGYLSSTGVYGDAGGAWVDETVSIRGRREGRNAADAAWLELGARVFRLPGIYGPGRSPLDRAAAGHAHRVDVPGQVFSRVHVDDIASGVIAGFDAPAGAYNLADDAPCGQNEVAAFAASLLGLEPPPFVPLEILSPIARAFYAENRRVANGKAKRVLGWSPAYPDYRLGLRALSAITRPMPVSTAPPIASGDQR